MRTGIEYPQFAMLLLPLSQNWLRCEKRTESEEASDLCYYTWPWTTSWNVGICLKGFRTEKKEALGVRPRNILHKSCRKAIVFWKIGTRSGLEFARLLNPRDSLLFMIMWSMDEKTTSTLQKWIRPADLPRGRLNFIARKVIGGFTSDKLTRSNIFFCFSIHGRRVNGNWLY